MSSLAKEIEAEFRQQARELFEQARGEQAEQAQWAIHAWAAYHELALAQPDKAEQHRASAKHAEGILINLAAQVRIDAQQRLHQTLADVLTRALGVALTVATA